MASLKMNQDELIEFLQSLPKPEQDGVKALLLHDDAEWEALDLDLDQLRAVNRHMKCIIQVDPLTPEETDDDQIEPKNG